MFAFTAAKRPLGPAAYLLPCLLAFALAGTAAAAAESGYLGVRLQELTPSMAKALQLGDRSGVIVNDVVDGGPAEKAGLLDGDVILELNGEKVADDAAFTESVRALAPGDKAQVLVLRDGAQKTIAVELGKREADEARRKIVIMTPDGEHMQDLEGLEELKGLEDFEWHGDGDTRVMVLPRGGGEPHVFFHGDGEGDGRSRMIVKTFDDDRGWLGVRMDALNGQLGEYFGVKDGAGVLVTEVVADGPAAKAGLKAGDVIVKVGDTAVAAPDALHEAMAGTKPGDELTLQVLRKGAPKTLTAKLGEMPEDAEMPNVEVFGNGGPGEYRMMLPRMLRRMGPVGGEGEHQVIIERNEQSGEELDQVRREMDALRDELKQLREELER